MIYNKIIDKVKYGVKQFAVLIDPEKSDALHLRTLLAEVNKADVDMILLGGSTGSHSASDVLSTIREYTSKEVVLFPGNVSHLTRGVDAVLFLSLISGRNPDYLIENHVKAAPLLKGVEIIPVGYILIDGGRRSATEQVSKTLPMNCDDVDKIAHTALAGEMMGNKMIYLEAGSGASKSIASGIISRVKSELTIPLIVGGGLKTSEDVERVYLAGADIVVVGNVLETNPELLPDLKHP